MRVVDLRWEGGVAVVTFGTDARKNALSSAFWSDLAACIDTLATREDLRAVVLCARGADFSSGVDLDPADPLVHALAQGMTGHVDAARDALGRVHDVLDRWSRIPVATIAAIEGVCLGGGLELALACDLRVCGSDARLGFPELQRGLTANLGGIGKLVALVGAARAKLLLLTGRKIAGRDAEALGLVELSAPSGEACAYALRLAHEIEHAAPNAARRVLQVVRDASAVDVRTRDAELAAALHVLASPEPLAGVTAFLQKQQPPWSPAP